MTSRLAFEKPNAQRALRLLRAFPPYPSYDSYSLTASNDPAFLWFRVAKVGTRSIFGQLRANGLALDERWHVRYPVNRCSEHFAFGFVRNPWDRLVSCWAGRVVRNNKYNFDDETRERMQRFPEFVRFVANTDLDSGDVHLRRQTGLLDLNRLDFLGRLERFDDDLATVLAELGLRHDAEMHKNPSPRDTDYRSYYDDDTAELVGRLYEKDVRTFGYEFDGTR